jgi:hypothetical protein
MVALTKNIKRWKVCVIGVAWKRPPYKPIPLYKKYMFKLLKAIRHEKSNIIIASLE